MRAVTLKLMELVQKSLFGMVETGRLFNIGPCAKIVFTPSGADVDAPNGPLHRVAFQEFMRVIYLPS